jgi:hypothetical protein
VILDIFNKRVGGEDMKKMLTLTPNLMVDDVKKTVDFYLCHLQFELVNSVSSENGYAWAMIKRDEVLVMLHETVSIKEEYPILSGQTPGGSFVLYLSVEDIDLFYEGFDKDLIVKDIHTTFYNMREFSIQDNNSYVLTFSEKIKP